MMAEPSGPTLETADFILQDAKRFRLLYFLKTNPFFAPQIRFVAALDYIVQRRQAALSRADSILDRRSIART